MLPLMLNLMTYSDPFFLKKIPLKMAVY